LYNTLHYHVNVFTYILLFITGPPDTAAVMSTLTSEDIMLAELACKFLNVLEVLPTLPVKNVMRRIHSRLGQLLEDETDGVAAAPILSAPPTRPPSPTPAPPQPDRVQLFKDAVAELTDLNRPLFCDIQMLQSTEGDVIKEFAVTADGGPTAWIMIRPPPLGTPKTLPNEFLRVHEHGITWDGGDMDLCDLEIITSDLFHGDDVKIYMKGQEKARLLVWMLGVQFESIYLLDHAPRLTNLRKMFPTSEQCPFHSRHGRSRMLCAVKNAHALLKFCENE